MAKQSEKSEVKEKSEAKPNDTFDQERAPGSFPGTPSGVPSQPADGKAERRLFGLGHQVKKWLTKDEAEKAGLFWKEEKKA